MKERPLLSFTVCWVAGSAAACLCSGSGLLLTWAGLIFLLVSLMVWGTVSWKYIAVLCLSISLATGYWEWNEARNISGIPEALGGTIAELNESSVEARGTIVSVVERDGDRVDFIMKLSHMNLLAEDDEKVSDPMDEQDKRGQGELIAVQIKLLAEQEIAIAGKWRRGDEVLLSGVLEEPAVARNFGGFDYRAYLHTKKIQWLLKGQGAENVRVTVPDSWSPLMIFRLNDSARMVLGAELDQLFQERHSGYMKGLIIGMQDDLDPDTFKQFSQLGLTHILAISGMHVAVYVGVLLFLFRHLRLTKETALTLTFILVPVYVLLSGAGPSIVRAGLMSMIALLAARVGMLKDGLNILAASALVMLIWNPYMLLSVSFQLSFLVTLGLMVYVPLMNPLLSILPRWLKGAVSVTLVAQLVSFPLTIYYFNQFSLLSFVANLVFVPFITFVVLPLGTLALLLGRLWEDAAKVLAHVTELLNNFTFYAVEWINEFTGGVLIWGSPSLLWIGVYYVLLYGVLNVAKLRKEARSAPQYMEDETRPLAEVGLPVNNYGEHGRSVNAQFAFGASMVGRWSGVIILLSAVGLGLLLYKGYQSDGQAGRGTISYLDIGQGDSILITTPSGAHILVDGGGTLNFGQKEEWRVRRSPFEVGAKVLVPLLKKRGIHRLDAIILTHGDQDHAGGLQAVLEEIPVSALLFNGTLVDREFYMGMLRTALERDVQLYAVHQGMTLSPDDKTELSFLWPEGRDGKAAGTPPLVGIPLLEEQNHDSVAFRLEMNGRNFLFTGDMDLEAEEEIVQLARQKGISAGPAIDVLKVAHHGSKTSTGEAWLEFWQPAAAVISAGVNNLYGHPKAEVLERLQENYAAIFRTDQQGEIQTRVRPDRIEVRYKLGSKR
ncbi:ComEC/Rec2 family competence protein [Paenibacillus sp.]|uniref:ComEC/Rec2 family competence protein n=1 Tax=Paenibacillus sp. TaxID=58172 RepID=UPI0028A75FE0|nr:ComEC/Rec2 family competence protein [Paenibacillus sp.]